MRHAFIWNTDATLRSAAQLALGGATPMIAETTAFISATVPQTAKTERRNWETNQIRHSEDRGRSPGRRRFVKYHRIKTGTFTASRKYNEHADENHFDTITVVSLIQIRHLK
ncbi:hypothetical protein ACT7DA_04115 [Bacillus pacificus]